MALTITEVAARRYAKALLDVAVADNLGDRCVLDLDRFTSAVAGVPDAQDLFANPTIPAQVVETAVGQLADRLGLHEVSRAFLCLLASRRRLGGVERIAAGYRQLQDEAAGRARGHVRAAGPVSGEIVSLLSERLGARIGKDLRLTAETDESLIGGLQVTVGDMVYDLSTRTWLDSLRTRLLQNR